MKVRDVMRIDVVTIPHRYTYEEVAKLLRENNLIGAPIVDQDSKLISMVTEKDLLRVLYPFAKSFYEQPEKYTNLEGREKKILEIKGDNIMKFAPAKHITTTLDTPILRIGGKMLARGLHAVPVVDENHNLLGIIFRRDIYRHIAKEHLGI